MVTGNDYLNVMASVGLDIDYLFESLDELKRHILEIVEEDMESLEEGWPDMQSILTHLDTMRTELQALERIAHPYVNEANKELDYQSDQADAHYNR